MLALRVERKKAEELRTELSELGLLDAGRKFMVEGEFVEIPITGLEGIDLKEWGAVSIEQESPVERAPVYDPHVEMAKRVRIPHELVEYLPSKWEQLGDVLIFKLDDRLRQYEEEIAKVYAEVLGAKTVLEDVGGVEENIRRPKVSTVWGTETVTIHKENGVLFKLDTKELMFSSGNIDERVRMAKVCEEGDIVVDMFAGIGYFSLPMAVHTNPAEIYSIEINPVAFEYLCENVRLNEVEETICPILGDCLEVAPEGLATRVVMGYLSGGDVYLPKAMSVIGDEGIVHYHESCPNELLPDRPISTVQKAAEGEGRKVEILRQRRIKSYAPGVSHIVLDVRVS
ncbi:MAG: class I SAM-dependent methyltransferase family protein [Methanomassiliicoccales archaeon]|nr:MAG: class I SAM-dependent methyltransferase family protein [Methanomassiliicoccales archaeon]